MKHVSCSHAAVAVTVDGTNVVLPESLEEKNVTQGIQNHL